jgi:Txe/YoeB family toxin of Txe-Axe toxin-antitoxin module
MDLLCTPRFSQQLRRYNGVQEVVAKRIAEMLRKSEADPKTWHFELEKLKDDSFGSMHVFKTAITYGDRLVFVVSANSLILCSVGDHDVMQDYANLDKRVREEDFKNQARCEPWLENKVGFYKKEKSKERRLEVSSEFSLSFLAEHGEGQQEDRWVYEEELSDAWVAFLDKEQNTISDSIFDEVSKPSEETEVFFILGGPGTGKTVILLNLAINLSKAGRAVSFELAPQVLKYLNSGAMRVPGANLGVGPGVVHLIDDPSTSRDLARQIRQAKSAKCRALVVGLDPLQWTERGMTERFEKIYSDHAVSYFPLWSCYRQSRKVGEKAIGISKSVFENVSRFLDPGKIQEDKESLQPYIDLSLGMKFVDQHGKYKIYEKATKEDFIEEISRFKARYDRWKHTNPIIFVYHDEVMMDTKKWLQSNSADLLRKDLNLENYRSIRGVEFQELFLFIEREYWEEISQGKYGLKVEDWEKFTCLHTLLSRPKDALVIFILDDGDFVEA